MSESGVFFLFGGYEGFDVEFMGGRVRWRR